ncbi:hypothetical protein BGW39_001813 [Mortierella sp. 14UC]|nr:hypothetical protein BGW39_001813 [Mortierella sp. 14UC]
MSEHPPEWDDSSHHYSSSNPKHNPNPYDFQLFHLTCLSVCKDVESGAFETLIRLCPNLEELSWMGPLDSDLEALTLNLSQCCPRVAVLTYSTVDVSEPEQRYADLVRSLPALVDLQIRIPTLEGGHFARALLEQHAGSLEILDLRIVNRRNAAAGDTDLTDMEAREQKSREHLRRILMGCSELTALSIEGAERMAEYLFLFTWACSHRLHRLFLGASIAYGGSVDTAGDDEDADAGEGEGEDAGATDQQDQQQQQEEQEHNLENSTAQGVSIRADEFLAEAALFGWSVVGREGTSACRRRHASDAGANGDDDHEEDEGEGDEEEVTIVNGGSSSNSINAASAPMSPSEYLDGISSSISEANITYEPSTITTYDEDTAMPIASSTIPRLIVATTESQNSSSSSSLSSSATAASSPSGPTAPSFVRDMMLRLEDMPRLQSFVINNVEYTRMHSLTAR